MTQLRIIPLSYLTPGMILGKDLYDNRRSLLLSRGHILTQKEIDRICLFKYQGIYVSDNAFDEDIEPTENVSEILRLNAVESVRDIFTSVKKPTDNITREVVTKVKDSVNDIVHEIVAAKSATYIMTDLKLYDDYTYYHSANVAVIAIVLGLSMGLNNSGLYKLGMGALLHDIGKMFIPKDILEKNGRLTEEEFKIIKTHSLKGNEYLKEKWDIPSDSNLAVLTHHEKFDGTGYPYGIKGEKIPLFGRILMVADVFDALSSDRSYRKAYSPIESIEYIIDNSGKLFDPDVIDAFIERVSPYPVGTHVILSNGLKGLVVETCPGYAMRPKIKVITDSGEPVYYDLSREKRLKDIKITGISYI